MLVASVVVTLTLALGILQRFAPRLLGLPMDLRLVRSSQEIPPFFDGVFRPADHGPGEFILNDPVTVLRARPGFPDIGEVGPNDILGFRNRAVPNVADVIVIGDSQTYGNNAMLEQSWPQRLAVHLGDRAPVVYGMATSGWGAVQYLDMIDKARWFEPRIVVVAFYSGNDALESFSLAYEMEAWASLRPDPTLSADDAPSVEFPEPEEQLWPVTFADGIRTVFTPHLRYASNQDHPAVLAGYQVMAMAAGQMGRALKPFEIEPVFTIIPTKELAYASKVERDGLTPPPAYTSLIEAERRNIAALAGSLRDVPRARYVDVTEALQEAALEATVLYPADADGHPLAAGYDVIARTVAERLRERLPPPPSGLYVSGVSEERLRLTVVNPEGVWEFPSEAAAIANGWREEQVQRVPARALATLRWRGLVSGVDPDRFGPGSIGSLAAE